MRVARIVPMLIALPRNRILATSRVAPLHVADLQIDALDPRVTQRQHEVRLTPSEHALLYTLAARRGTVVTHAELAEALAAVSGVKINTIARHMTTLRGKLGDDFRDPRYIETIPGSGYRFKGAPAG